MEWAFEILRPEACHAGLMLHMDKQHLACLLVLAMKWVLAKILTTESWSAMSATGSGAGLGRCGV